MEQRAGNMIIQTPGGTASKDSKTYKVALPSAWVRAMGITAFDRQIELRFDGTAITIAKRQTLRESIVTIGHLFKQHFGFALPDALNRLGSDKKRMAYLAGLQRKSRAYGPSYNT